METRIEKDSLGNVEVPAKMYWGAQTQRSLENFKIGSQKMTRSMIWSMGQTKKACALTNKELGKLDKEKASLISQASDDVIRGKLDDNFPLVVWQTGSGTQSNMNANEVISNRAIEISGGKRGSKTPVHPNDDVNKSQSSNDTFPTYMHLACIKDLEEKLFPALNTIKTSLKKKVKEFEKIVKIGRTHMMDATPLTLGQEMSGYLAQMEGAEKQIRSALESVYELSLGGTAVGTGINSHPEFGEKVAAKISELTGFPVKTAPNKFAALASHDPMVAMSSGLKLLAVAAMKMGNDIRLLASGPRCGLGELRLPANEPGSSIMPGKVNPTQCEALTMVCAQVMGNDTTITFAGSQGHLELNVYKPVIIHNLLESIDILSGALVSFTEKCLEGIEADPERIKQNLNNSLMLVTALNQVIGYDKAAEIAKLAWNKNMTLKEACLELNYLSESDFDKYVKPEEMVHP